MEGSNYLFCKPHPVGKTYTFKGKLARKTKLFHFKNAGMVFKVLIAFTIASLLEISQHLILSPTTRPTNKNERFLQYNFLPK